MLEQGAGATNTGNRLDIINENGDDDASNVFNSNGGTVINFNAARGYVGLLGDANSGSSDQVNGSNGTIGTWYNTHFAVNGNNDYIFMDAAPDDSSTAASTGSVTGDTLEEYGVVNNFTVTNTGNGLDTINEDSAGDRTDVQNQGGGTITVNFNTAGGYAGLLGGSGYQVNGDGGEIRTSVNTNFAVSGSNDHVYINAGDVAAVSGNSSMAFIGGYPADLTDSSTNLTLVVAGGGSSSAANAADIIRNFGVGRGAVVDLTG